MQTITFDYIYGSQSESFNFYRIPRLLITGERFQGLSTDAKLLYGLMLDRMDLSAKNGWYDSQGRVYIYYSLDEIQTNLNCGHDKAVKMLAELDIGKGIGLIERVKQGQGRPARIYVKQFTSARVQDEELPPGEMNITDAERRSQEVSNPEVQTSGNQTFRLPENRSLDSGKAEGNHTNTNYPYRNYLNQSINLTADPEMKFEDRSAVRSALKENIGYPHLAERYTREDVNELVELLCDVLCSSKATIRVGGTELSADLVKERFWSLRQPHIEYVFEQMNENTRKIHNIRGYLLTVLYHTPERVEQARKRSARQSTKETYPTENEPNGRAPDGELFVCPEQSAPNVAGPGDGVTVV